MSMSNMKYPTTLWFAVALSCVVTSFSETPSSNLCCEWGVLIANTTFCRNDERLRIECDSGRMLLFHDDSEDQRFIEERYNTRTRLSLYGTGDVLEQPYYCVGQTAYSSSPAAVICIKERWRDSEDDDHRYHRIDNRSWWEILLPAILLILNIISTITLGITTCIYGFLKEVQGTQDKCIFHVSLNTCLAHAVLSYVLFFKNGILPNACITQMYLLVYLGLAMWAWFTIAGHNSWIRTKVDVFIEDCRLMNKYLIFGYGFPALIVLLCNISAHARKLYTEFEFELQCYKHQSAIFNLLVILPVLGCAALSCFYFFDTQRRLWNSPTLKMRSQKSTLKMMKYRLILNGKVFISTGLLWIFGFIFYNVTYLLSFVIHIPLLVVIYSGYLMMTIVSAEGILVFLVLVVYRKRVMKGIARLPWFSNRNIFPENWKTMIDSETAVESDLEGNLDVDVGKEQMTS